MKIKFNFSIKFQMAVMPSGNRQYMVYRDNWLFGYCTTSFEWLGAKELLFERSWMFVTATSIHMMGTHQHARMPEPTTECRERECSRVFVLFAETNVQERNGSLNFHFLALLALFSWHWTEEPRNRETERYRMQNDSWIPFAFVCVCVWFYHFQLAWWVSCTNCTILYFSIIFCFSFVCLCSILFFVYTFSEMKWKMNEN